MTTLVVSSFVVALAGICAAQTAGPNQGWVVIPINQYESLRGKAFPVDREPEPPPVEATLTRIDYDLRIDGAVASGKASLTIDVLKDGWVRVPIPQGLFVRDAKLDGKTVSLVGTRPGPVSAVLSKRGRSVLALDVAFNITSASGEEKLSLPAGVSGVTRAAIGRIPQDVDVRVTGGFTPEKSSPHWLAFAKGGEPLVFTWRKRIEERREELPLRMRGSLTQLLSLGEDSNAVSAEVTLDVVQGSAMQVKIAVPDGITINQVPGATVADWDVKQGELVVNFLEPVERSGKFSINGEVKLAREGVVALPLMKLLGTERDTGGVAVEVLGAGEIKDTKPQGLEAVEPAELGAMVAGRPSPSLAAFRLTPGSQPRSLAVEVVRYTQQAVLTANVEEARYRALLTRDGKTLVEARYAVRNNQRNFLRVAMPMGATLWSSAVAGKPVRPGKSPDGNLLIPLPKQAGEDSPAFLVEVLYLARAGEWGEKDHVVLNLPALDLPVSKTGVMVYYPPQYRLTAEVGAFRAQAYEDPSSGAFTAAPVVAAGPQQLMNSDATQALVDRYNARAGLRKVADSGPVGVTFPAVGPTIFLVSELTADGKAPSGGAELSAGEGEGEMKSRLLLMMVAPIAFVAAQENPLPGAGNVSLTLGEYDRLVALAGQAPKRIETPPYPFLVKSAQFKMDVRGETVTGTVDVEGEVFVKGDRKVPLVSDLTVLEAREQGRELPIEQSGGMHSGLITGPREFAVTLDAGLPLSIETGRASFNLPAPAAGLARLTLTVPGDQTLVNINPGLITAKSSSGGKTTIEATLVPGQISNVWWAARLNLTAAPPAAPKPARFLSDLKTLISVSESELGLAALAEITVVQGDPAEFTVQAPDGYEMTGATGPTLISSDVQGSTITLKVEHPEARTHQFLISMAKANTTPKAEVPLLMVQGAQRETGEVLVEGEGAIELTAAEHGGLRRMDIKEISPYLTSLAHSTLHAAFRYQKRPSELPLVGLEWTRFPDSGVLSAVAQNATVTTLVTTEGRTLTEVKLTLKNKAQPFLKVGLPAGASILTADVAGEKVKPVEGSDGNRVPLLRPGFKPQRSYTVSFVVLGAGASLPTEEGWYRARAAEDGHSHWSCGVGGFLAAAVSRVGLWGRRDFAEARAGDG